jgi:hypothetical protein
VIEKVVAEYIELQERLHKKDDGCSMRWQFLATKAMKAADALGIQNFNALARWIQGMLQDNKMVSMKLHGEANEMTDHEAAANIMKGWLTEFHKTIEELGVPSDHIYNAKQTGLYYTKLPETSNSCIHQQSKLESHQRMQANEVKRLHYSHALYCCKWIEGATTSNWKIKTTWCCFEV